MSIYTNWDPLETVIVGNCHTSVSEKLIKDPRTRMLLEKILTETKEDLDSLAALLEKLGAEVLRPTPLDYSENIPFPNFDVLHATNPIVPRDQYFAYGDTIYQTYTSMPDRYLDSLQYYDIFKLLFDRGYNWISQPPPVLENITVDKKWYVQGQDIYHRMHKNKVLWHTATMFKCGEDIITNTKGPGNTNGLEWMQRNLSANIISNVGACADNWGHIDHGFYMPNDDTVICMDQKWIPESLTNKQIIDLKGHFTPFDYQTYLKKTSHYSNHVSKQWLEDWLEEWMGYTQKTAFEGNVLVVDPFNIIFAIEQPGVFELLAKHGINCHVLPIRHGMFWEAGIHCLTLDVSRRGNKRKII